MNLEQKLDLRIEENLECLAVADNRELFDYLKHEIAIDILTLYRHEEKQKAINYTETYLSIIKESEYR